MCGKDNLLVKAEIEGVLMQVCSTCSRYGVVKQSSARPDFQRKVIRKEGPELAVVSDFSVQLRKVREGLGLKQEDFAKYLQERESVVSKWEQGSLTPSVETAQHLGRILGLNLLSKTIDSGEKLEVKTRSDELTLGDFVKVRKRK